MENSVKTRLHEFLQECLAQAGDRNEFADNSSLFASGRLDSLSMTRLVMFLEEEFDVDFGNVDFDVELIDSLNDIQLLIDTELRRRA